MSGDPTPKQPTAQRSFSDSEGDGPQFEVNGVRLGGNKSLATWRDFYNRNMNWNGKALYTCVMAFDKHNVVDTLNEEEASRFAVLRNKVQYYNNLGGALAVISRGPSKWKI